MKHHSTLPAAYVDTQKAKLLVAKVHKPIEADSFLVLRRDGEKYRFEVIQQSNDTSDPAVLASFLPPEAIDASELFHAACIGFEASKPKRKRKTASKAKTNEVNAR